MRRHPELASALVLAVTSGTAQLQRPTIVFELECEEVKVGCGG